MTARNNPICNVSARQYEELAPPVLSKFAQNTRPEYVSITRKRRVRMFEKNSRYITKGIQERMPSELINAMWLSIDICNTDDSETDYLQVFKFEVIEEKILVITHTQEEPERSNTTYMPYKDEYKDIISETVFVIDDGDHNTMLFAYEY